MEHVALLLRNKIYAIGGYDALENVFINSCERYDIEQNTWHNVSNLKMAKCAFAATVVQDRYIYTFGGYDGKERLDIVE